MEYALKDILPNPFRHLERYPINREKVDALKESMQSTSFWDNLVARIVDGKPQIAYGHHRMVALKELYGDKHEIPLIIRELDDETMLKIMARENMEEWGASVSIEHETVRAVVQAFGEGKIKLRKIAVDSQSALRTARVAPSFLTYEKMGSRRTPDDIVGALVYNVTTVGEFLGWMHKSGRVNHRCEGALNALEFIELGALSEKDFIGLTMVQALAVTAQASAAFTRQLSSLNTIRDRFADDKESSTKGKTSATRYAAIARADDRAKKIDSILEKAKAEASKVGKAVSKKIESGEIGYREARRAVVSREGKVTPSLPDINAYAKTLTREISAFLNKDSNRHKSLTQVISFRESLRPIVKEELADALNSLVFNAEKCVDELKKPVAHKQQPKALLEGGK